MKKIILIFFIICLNSKSYSSVQNNIIQNLQIIDNISFNFEQNINGKIENGTCTIEYPKKMYCKYDLKNQKTLISDGKSLVIKTISSFYQYPLNKTPLNFILDKKYLLEKLAKLDGEIIIKNFINLNFFENDSQINIFFDKKNFNLVGWQTLDIYQNLSITYLDSIVKNKKIKKNLFELPGRN